MKTINPLGLAYLPNFIDLKFEQNLIQEIDSLHWENAFKRRVQQYGYRFDYLLRKINFNSYKHFPNAIGKLADMIYKNRFMETRSDQLFINEYKIGEGIEDHIDSKECFGDTIAIISIGSGCLMNFQYERDDRCQKTLYLEPLSLLIISGEARYNWQHGIPEVSADWYNETLIPRKRRISLSFRTAVLNPNFKPKHG